ncbi:VWA domain-containing protein [Methanomethylovorans sp.]|uniref:VWA domain-containing protein n=1 Tax=Methanomethylovorans sp. TaxID=2758717 RepID=UPI00351C0808
MKFIILSLILVSLSMSAMALTIEVYPLHIQNSAGDNLSVTVRVTDNSTPLNNIVVNFITSLGYLSSTSTLTNESGYGRVFLTTTESGLSIVNASIGSFSNTANITFSPLSPESITIAESENPVTAGNITTVTIGVLDQFGNVNSTAELTLDITIEDVFGNALKETQVTRTPYTLTHIWASRNLTDNGIGDIVLTNSATTDQNIILAINSTIAGNINISASCGGVSNSKVIEIQPAAPSGIGLWYNDEYTVNTTSSITVRVYDMYDNPVGNSLILFNATPPAHTPYNSPNQFNSLYLSNPSPITGIDGIVFTEFRTDKRAGDNNISITLANSSVRSDITITGLADVVDNLFLTNSPTSSYANNEDIYRVTCQAVDQFLNPIIPDDFPIKEQVVFYSGSSSIIVPLNEEGKASTQVGPTPYVENVSINATYKDASGYTNITTSTILEFIAGSDLTLNIYASTEALLARGLNGNHESTIKVIAIDQWGHTLPGINVTISTTNATLGNLSMNGVNATTINAITNNLGKVTFQFFCSNVAGNTTIFATVANVSAAIPITIRDVPFLSTSIDVEPETLKSGDIVNVTTMVSIEGDLQITRPAANAVLVLDRSGSMDPDYYAGPPMDVVLVLDRSGSMTDDGSNPPQPMTNVKNAAKDFLDNLVSNSKVGLVSFSSSASTDRALTLMNSYDNKTSIKTGISALNPSGMTAIGDAMAAADNLLVNGRTDTKKVMVLLTDGVCNTGSDMECDNAISVCQANDIIVYTIGLGTNLDEPLLQKIAFETNGKYYNAPTSSDLEEVYNSIAQEICDYDITAIEYGTEGFTSYDYTAQGSVTGSGVFTGTFLVNRTINDLKVQLDWTHNNKNLNLELIAPDGTKYGMGNNTKGYYPNSTTTPSEYIWIYPLPYIYPDYDADSVPTGSWTVRVKGYGTGTENFRIKTYIDKKSATKIASHSFISSFDESRGDNAGLVLYSFDSVASTASQASYVRNDSTWVGYFTVDEDADYNFNLSWVDSSKLGFALYDGIELLDYSNSTTNFCTVSSPLYAGNTYHLEVSKYSGPQNDTAFNISVSSTDLRTVMGTYYDSTGGGGTPRYRNWNAQRWSDELSANYVGGRSNFIVTAPSPIEPEMIMGTLDDQRDINVQVWDGSTWGSVQELSTSADSAARRAFDIAYEQVSGDALIAYMDMGIDDGIPRYRTWNGVSWSSAGAANAISSGAGDVGWVKMASDPFSDEIILVTLDDSLDMRAQVWNGNSWGNAISITNNAETYDYQCFDVIYEQQTGRAFVVWADGTSNTVKYRIWNGSSWSGENTLVTYDYSSVYWIKTAADPNSNNIIMGIETVDYDVYVTVWNGASWSTLLRVETSVYDYGRRSVDVAFEQESGRGIVVWGDSSTVPKYRTWDGSWSSEASASNLQGSSYTRWVQLTPDTSSNEIFLMTSDGASDISIQKWDGTEWSVVSEVETSSSYNYECFDLDLTAQDSSIESTPVTWTEWRASVISTLQNDSLSHLSSAIDTMTADGLTAIDEGLYEANAELAAIDANSTIVIMTDGLDNAGYHSLMLEALEAKERNTTIYTVGFGNNESDVDPVLSEIASITGGEYYFAPNSSVLESIFKGIAEQITDFAADGPVLNIHIPRNYATPYTIAKATYISGSSNNTLGNRTSFVTPKSPKRGNAEPVITTLSDRSVLTWQLPNLSPGEKWGVWYQMVVQGSGYVPLIMPQSNITYMDLNGTNVTVSVPAGAGGSITGNYGGINPSLIDVSITSDRSMLLINDPSDLELAVKDTETGDPAVATVIVYTTLGFFNDYENPIVMYDVSGAETLNFSSATAGNAYVTAYLWDNNTIRDDALIVIRPKGMIRIK